MLRTHRTMGHLRREMKPLQDKLGGPRRALLHAPPPLMTFLTTSMSPRGKQDRTAKWFACYQPATKSAQDMAGRYIVCTQLEVARCQLQRTWRHDVSTPQRPESNGVAEQAARQMLEGARSLLLQLGLPHPFWCDAPARRETCPVQSFPLCVEKHSNPPVKGRVVFDGVLRLRSELGRRSFCGTCIISVSYESLGDDRPHGMPEGLDRKAYTQSELKWAETWIFCHEIIVGSVGSRNTRTL